MTSEDAVQARASSALLISGGIAALVGGATHGDLPEGSGALALQFVADHPAYALVHFVSIFGGVLWAVGLASCHVLRASVFARWLTRAGGHVALIGAAVLAVQFSLDGVGVEALAARWSTPGADQGMLETVASLAPDVLIGVALTWVMLLYGLAPLLAGWALLVDRHAILGWAGVTLGVFATLGTLSRVLGFTMVPDWLVFAGSVMGGSIWAIALGVYGLIGVARQQASDH